MKLSPLLPALRVDLGNGVEVYFTEATSVATGLRRVKASVWNGRLLAEAVIRPDLADERRRFARLTAKADPTSVPDPDAVELALMQLAHALSSSAATNTGQASGASPSGNVYQETPAGLLWLKPTNSGNVPVSLTNFTAKIVADTALDDGQDVQRQFEIEASLHGQVKRFSLPAVKFAAMAWPTEYLGASAIVAPGLGLRDHARAAIQWLSGNVPERQVYTHVGWRKLGPDWVYLQSGGATGGAGPVAGVEVRLSDPLSRYVLPNVPNPDELVRAIRASLRVLELAPAHIAVPILAGTYRATLGPADFSLHLAGPTGQGKTEFAALAQQHYGAEMDARHLPGSWLSTGNALEVLAFGAKDAVLVVDDFAPTGSPQDVQRFHREGDRLLRAQGNHAGRQRLNRDATLQMSKYPRGLLISTGEEVPKGQSLRARMLVLELSPGDLDWAILTECQRAAAGGLFAQAMAGFIQWLAPQYEGMSAKVRAEAERLRDSAPNGQHKRTPSIIADLAVGLEYFLHYAEGSQALSADESAQLWQEAWAALARAGELHGGRQGESEPAHRFLDLVSSAIAAGYAHLASPTGSDPANPVAWGWRGREVNTGLSSYTEWMPQGKRIGWVEGDKVYLEPNAAFAVAQELGQRIGDGLAVTSPTLRRRLKEQGLLAGWDNARQTLTVRRRLEGQERDVLFFNSERLYTDKKPDIPDISEADSATLQGQESTRGRDGATKGDSDRSPEQVSLGAANVGNVGLNSGRESSEAEKTMSIFDSTWKDGLSDEDGPQEIKGDDSLFVLTSDWQEAPAGAVLPAGVECRMDFASGKTYARRIKDDTQRQGVIDRSQERVEEPKATRQAAGVGADSGQSAGLRCALCGKPAFCLLADAGPVCKEHALDDVRWLPLPE